MVASRHYCTVALLLAILMPFIIHVEGQKNNGNRANQSVNGRQNINSAALLIGAAGLVATAGTVGFLGGLIIGENDRFRGSRRRPFRGKRNLATLNMDQHVT